MKKKIQKFFKFIFVKNADHAIWVISSGLMFLIIVVFAVYTFAPDLQRSVNGLIPGTQETAQTQEKIFQLPVTVVYDSSSQAQKTRMDKFLGNLTDPKQALRSTQLKTTWLDSKTPQAQQLIAESGLKYLPQIFLDPSIEQHPQFSALKQYLNKKGDVYFIRLASLENLEIPPVTDGHFAGADPLKAKVVIQAYGSYACEQCVAIQSVLKQIVKNYPTTVSVVYKHFEPGDSYNQIAQSAECATEQNKFFEMQDLLYKGQAEMLSKLDPLLESAGNAANPQNSAAAVKTYIKQLLEGYAQKLHLNFKKFQTCLSDQTYLKAIDQQTLDAIDYGVNGPPAFFINKKFESGLASYDDFKSLIDQELQ